MPSLKPPSQNEIPKPEPSAFELPHLPAYAHNALPPLEDLPSAYASSQEDLSRTLSPDLPSLHRLARHSPDEEDVWRDPAELPTLRGETKLLTWASFSNSTKRDGQKARVENVGYLSEAGPAAFDAALTEREAVSDGRLQAGRAIRSDPYLNSLLELGLGRPSTLFHVEDGGSTFKAALEDGRASGSSLEVSRSLVEGLKDLGEKTLQLSHFVEATFELNRSCAGLVALASVIRAVLSSVQEYCVSRRKNVTSLLQLQDLFERPKELIAMLMEIYRRLGVGAEFMIKITDENLASATFEVLQEQEDRGEDSQLMQRFLKRVAQPWLENLESSIGLRQGASLSEYNIDGPPVTQRGTDQASAEERSLPNFVTQADAALVQETNDCINFMQEHHPDHPLSNPAKLNSNHYGFEWAFGWDDVDRIASKASEYQHMMHSAIGTFGERATSILPSPESVSSMRGETREIDPWAINDFMLDIEDPSGALKDISDSSRLPDELYSLIATRLASALVDEPIPFNIPTSLIIQHSLTPVLQAQHNLLATASLHAILHIHSLQHHLNTLHSFHLFGSGHFTTALSDILFDSSNSLSERRKGITRSGTLGLHLGSGQRREWPPTSSELSLALMGVLESCGANDHKPSGQAFNFPHSSNDGHAHTADPEGNGALSFALRTDLDPKTIDKVLDADTIFALDFLKLSYTPPKALEILFPAEVLEKYDRVFKLLLRLLRVHFVVGQLFVDLHITNCRGRGSYGSFNSEARLRQAIRHRVIYFLSTLLSYSRHTGIEAPWRRFMSFISDAEIATTSTTPDPDTSRSPSDRTTSGPTPSLKALLATHSITLDQMLTHLFLRNRQRKIAEALEDCLGCILDFAKMVHSSSSPPSRGGTGNAADGGADGAQDRGVKWRKLYERFNASVGAFIGRLEEAAERAEMGKKRGGFGVNTGGIGPGEGEGRDEEAEGVVEAFGGLAALLRWGGA